MALPAYATTGQKLGYYSFLTYCGLVFFFLIAPIFIILPLSFSASPFFEFTREFMNFEPEAWSLRWYRQMVGIASVGDTTVVSPMLLMPTICLYHLRDQASGSRFINSLVNSKNGEALNDKGRITKIGAIKKKKTKPQ